MPMKTRKSKRGILSSKTPDESMAHNESKTVELGEPMVEAFTGTSMSTTASQTDISWLKADHVKLEDLMKKDSIEMPNTTNAAQTGILTLIPPGEQEKESFISISIEKNDPKQDDSLNFSIKTNAFEASGFLFKNPDESTGPTESKIPKLDKPMKKDSIDSKAAFRIELGKLLKKALNEASKATEASKTDISPLIAPDVSSTQPEFNMPLVKLEKILKEDFYDQQPITTKASPTAAILPLKTADVSSTQSEFNMPLVKLETIFEEDFNEMPINTKSSQTDILSLKTLEEFQTQFESNIVKPNEPMDGDSIETSKNTKASQTDIFSLKAANASETQSESEIAKLDENEDLINEH